MRNLIAAVALLLILLACAQVTVQEGLQDPTTALVIIGFTGEVNWHTVWSNDHHMRKFKYPDLAVNDVVLLPVTVGTRFQVTELEHHSAQQDFVFTFKKAPTTKINRKSIYYYGVIESQLTGPASVRARIGTQVDQALIDRAKQKYPYVFANDPEIRLPANDADLRGVEFIRQ